MTESLSSEVLSESSTRFESLLGPRKLINDSWMLKHALVSSVRRLSRRYLVARLEVMEGFREPEPAQFIMIWIPGVDYLPMSVARYLGGGVIEVFFNVRGEGTKALSMSEGRVVGIVGPLGRGLRLDSRLKYLLIAGGSGLAPIVRVAEVLKGLGAEFRAVWGTRLGVDVGDVPRYFREAVNHELIVCSEDCSVGECGKASEVAVRVAEGLGNGFEVIAAGPKQMLASLTNSFKALGIDPVLITEAMVKCGIGLCGECLIGNGLRLCRDGPAFRSSEIINYLRGG